MRNVPGLEAIYRDYKNKGVQFLIIYKSIVHPGTNGVIDAFTKEERLKQLALAKMRLGTTVPIVSDSLDGDIVKALKSAPNAEFVVDAEGTIVYRKFWHDPAALRSFLEERVGKVDNPTKVADLNMKLVFPKAGAPRGLVKPVKMPGRMAILNTAPELPEDASSKDDAPPFFAKLLAEADGKAMSGGEGKLYLGFYLDPVYQVHWNNPAGGLSYSIDAPNDDDFEPVVGQTPKYKHDTDVDPREFVIDFQAPKPGAKLRLTVRYTICDDNGKFCMPVEQHYTLEMTRKRGGASRAGEWMTDLVGDPMSYDKDGDGLASRDELPKKRAMIMLLHYDRNHDEAIDQEEAALFYDMIRMEQGKGEESKKDELPRPRTGGGH
ncbi:MAG: hypothetical protein ACI89X_001250 [Planctomycetota bacterium]